MKAIQSKSIERNTTLIDFILRVVILVLKGRRQWRGIESEYLVN